MPEWSTEGVEAHPEHSHEAAALDHLHAFTPGDGQVEEEVIDEEEYDFAPLPEHAMAHDDEHDLSDLVEEETRVAGGAEIGDVIRDAQIDRQVISSDDDDFEDSDEEEDEGVEEESLQRRSPRKRERRHRGADVAIASVEDASAVDAAAMGAANQRRRATCRSSPSC